MDARWVADFAELRLSAAPEYGGKSANLGEMTGAGFPVPPGFSVGQSAYLTAMESAGVRSRLYDGRVPEEGMSEAELMSLAAELSSTVAGVEMPSRLREEVVAHYRSLGPDVPVAVRSSAPAEDAGDTSFAGIHESYTDVVGEEAVLKAVQDCWCSLWTPRAMTYRAVSGYDDEPSIAVVVQKMVRSDTSGVAFTADPRTSQVDRVVIEAAFGLGEVVVGGKVEPDTYVVSKSDLHILTVHVGRKVSRIVAGRTADGLVPVPEAEQLDRVLDDDQVRRVARLAVMSEQHYGEPQDTEFAFEDGELYIVQTRPITTLDADAAHAEDAAGAGSEVEPIVSGLGAGPGTAIGTARVLTELADGVNLAAGEILVATMTDPDWLPILQRAAAIVTDEGGVTCHAAIVGRELGRPVIVGTRSATADIADGQTITVDGTAGVVYPGEVRAAEAPQAPADAGAAPEVRTREVTATAVYVNLATPDAAARVAAMDVDGVGLLRAEFLITSALQGLHPRRLIAEGRTEEYVERMASGISTIAAAFDPRPVVYRATDLRSNEFRGLLGGEVEAEERNPMIGYRGCFRYTREPDLFRLELDALERVRRRHRNLHLMIPFVRTGWELRACLDIIDAHPIGRDTGLKRWIMAEVPSVVHWIPEYATMGIDGVSIGSNDLTQLTLGVDRDSEVCADLFDSMDPAVLAFIDQIIDRCHESGLTVSLCGQAASTDPRMAEHLVRKGVTSVSVTPDYAEMTRRTVARAERTILLDAARAACRPTHE
ncbi:phosphoenolpyruvate synthase [Dietzia maris]|uniref:Phosphoenolpyruvate synthase n=1 Tax=Dietzia maris TaxID=37915 RepID=A0A365P8N1_9ACTN|nr:phosphoenolpyruvate synthase [Dietzia sp. IN118]MDV3354177.1 phosphoenolpyruvate synthase [Dietzia sp. IN118]RBA33639.1 phosphoenolpyruvate synthase [Dietzia maris]